MVERQEIGSQLESLIGAIREDFEARHAAREAGLAASRRVIQHSANSIRAMHRREFDDAESLLGQARERAQEAQQALADYPEIYHAGFVHDALKEYAEASIFLAVARGSALPTPAELGIEYAAYLNGLAEAVGELRRYTLDAMRRGEPELPEALLAAMDEIYSQLVTIDFPDAITKGLRRHTDMVRGVTERTRGDLTLAAMNERLEREMAALRESLTQAD
jgi:translin